MAAPIPPMLKYSVVYNLLNCPPIVIKFESKFIVCKVLYFKAQYFLRLQSPVERRGAVVKRRTRDREEPGSIPTNCKCCFLEQETLSTLLSTGLYPGKKRATWKISTRLLNVLPSINKVDYYYYYYLMTTESLKFISFNGL